MFKKLVNIFSSDYMLPEAVIELPRAKDASVAVKLCFLWRENRFCDFTPSNSFAFIEDSRVLIFHSDSNLGHRTTFCLIANPLYLLLWFLLFRNVIFAHRLWSILRCLHCKWKWKFPKFGQPDILLGFGNKRKHWPREETMPQSRHEMVSIKAVFRNLL